MTQSLGTEPGPHWWEANVLTIAPLGHHSTLKEFSSIVLTRTPHAAICHPLLHRVSAMKLWAFNFLTGYVLFVLLRVQRKRKC